MGRVAKSSVLEAVCIGLVQRPALRGNWHSTVLGFSDATCTHFCAWFLMVFACENRSGGLQVGVLLHSPWFCSRSRVPLGEVSFCALGSRRSVCAGSLRQSWMQPSWLASTPAERFRPRIDNLIRDRRCVRSKLENPGPAWHCSGFRGLPPGPAWNVELSVIRIARLRTWTLGR